MNQVSQQICRLYIYLPHSPASGRAVEQRTALRRQIKAYAEQPSKAALAIPPTSKPPLWRNMDGGPTTEKIEISRSSCMLTMYVRSGLGRVLPCLSDACSSLEVDTVAVRDIIG